MNRNTFNQLIQQGSWHELFITEMGWNAPQGQHFLPTITVDDTDYDFKLWHSATVSRFSHVR